MSQEKQAEILCAIAKDIIKEQSGNWLLYVTYRPANGIDDNLTKDRECCMLITECEVVEYLHTRIETYDPKIGMFIDVACEMVDKEGNVACHIDWCHVGFADESMNLTIDYYDNNRMVENMSTTTIEEPLNLLRSEIFSSENGYAPFIKSENLLVDNV